MVDTHQLLLDVKELGPALSAVVVVGVLCYTFIKLFTQLVNRLLDLFKELGESIKAINDNTLRNTQTLTELVRSVEMQNRVLEKFERFAERRLPKDGMM